MFLCFLIHCLGLSSLSCQEAVVFWFHCCNHHPQWLWSPRRGNLSLLSPFHLLFAMPCNGARCHDLSFLIFSLKLALSLSSFTLIKMLFSSSLPSPIRVIQNRNFTRHCFSLLCNLPYVFFFFPILFLNASLYWFHDPLLSFNDNLKNTVETICEWRMMALSGSESQNL